MNKTETAARSEKLMLFVWTEFSPDYSGGLAFAIAQDESEARALIELDRGYAVYDWGDLMIYPLTSPVAKSVAGGG